MKILSWISLGLGATILAWTFFTPGCSHQAKTANGNLRTVDMQIGKKSFTLEVADKAATREIGLMWRDSIPSDHGMLFVFPTQEPLSFWMKNTRIPLDIIYLDADGRVVSIKQMQPHNLRGVSSDGLAKYGIELNQGVAEKTGVKPGDLLQIPDNARQAKD